MQLIKLTLINGGEVWVNPDKIVKAVPENPFTWLHLADDVVKSVMIRQSPKEINDIIRLGNDIMHLPKPSEGQELKRFGDGK